MNKKYEAWPLGRLRKEWQRTELEDVKSIGYDWDDPRDVVDAFEEEVAKLAGSKYAVAVDCCSHGLFLSMKYLQCIGTDTQVLFGMEISPVHCKYFIDKNKP